MFFSITNAQEFSKKVKYDLEQFLLDKSNSYLAMNAALSVYHLHEWLWKYNLKPNNCFSTLTAFKSWLDTNCPDFAIVQDLANGAKHTGLKHETKAISGYGCGPFGVGPYVQKYLLITIEGTRHMDAYVTISKVGKFMLSISEKPNTP